MPYKNTEERREHNREHMREKRGTQTGNTTGVTQVKTQADVDAKASAMLERITHPGAAPGYKVLSDGQLWYPGNNGYHPQGCNCGIEHKR